MDDYGHYGKGTEGYVHYMQEVDKSGGGGGGGNKGRWTLGKVIVVILFIYALLQDIASWCH